MSSTRDGSRMHTEDAPARHNEFPCVRKKILVVDDEPFIVKMLKARLEANDFSVVTAQDGAEGYEVAERECPDLIISDVLMPKMDGLAFIHELKKNKRLEGIPIIVLSAVPAHSIFEDRDHIHAFVSKPFNPDELVGKIFGLL